MIVEILKSCCEYIIIIVLVFVIINGYVFLFKMDGSAVIYCPVLGFKTKGDLSALGLFCERERKKRGKIRTWRRENNI